MQAQPSIDRIRHVLVVGAGAMGVQIGAARLHEQAHHGRRAGRGWYEYAQ